MPKTPVKANLLGDLSTYSRAPPPSLHLAAAPPAAIDPAVISPNPLSCSVLLGTDSSRLLSEEDSLMGASAVESSSGGSSASGGSESSSDDLTSLLEDALKDPSEDPCLSEGAAAFDLLGDDDDDGVIATSAAGLLGVGTLALASDSSWIVD